MQNGCKPIIFVPDLSIRQLAVSEGDTGRFARAVNHQGPGLVSQVDEIQQLRNRKIAQVSPESHGLPQLCRKYTTTTLTDRKIKPFPPLHKAY
jgi:hypothetical protein